MKYNVGDRVRIKSLDWYNQILSIPSKIVGKNDFVAIECGAHIFTKEMCKFCGRVMTIKDIGIDFYLMDEDVLGYEFTDEMIEGLMKEETIVDYVKESNDRYRIVIDPRFDIEVDEGEYYAVRRKKEYPKTYEECCEILKGEFIQDDIGECYVAGYFAYELECFQKLLICRDAYWKLYGEEMGLGKPWEPDWEDYEHKKFVFIVEGNTLIEKEYSIQRCFLAFPTKEMQDAFYENFKEEIEICKELL